MLLDLGAQGVAPLDPAVDRALQPVLAHRPDAALERRPEHRPRVGEVLQVGADLPDAVVLAVEVLLDEVEQGELEAPRELVVGDADRAGLLEREHDLAEHVALELQVRGVADPHRRGAPVAGQALHLVLGQAPLARQPVHDLHVGRIAGDRPQQPVAPLLGLGLEAVLHERLERQGGVAQPDVAVVPVAHAAVLLGQARGRGGDDAAGVLVGEGAQHQQRAAHLRVVAARDRRSGPPTPATSAGCA